MPILLMIEMVSSCSRAIKSAKINGLITDYCALPNSHDNLETVSSEQPVANQDSILKQKLSGREIFISKAAGIDVLFARLLKTGNDTLQQLMLLQKITGRLALAITEIDAVAGQLDCNGDRISLLAKYVDNINSNSTKKLTIASVALGALTTVAVAALNNNSQANTIVGVTGGLARAGFAAVIISL